jgi:methyltransferase
LSAASAHADPFGVLVLGLVTAQRLAELVYSRWNEKRLRALGAVEFGRGHYPLIVGLHVLWIAGLWLLARNIRPDPFWLALYAVLQGLRAWVLASLGRRWTTRIIVLPGAKLARSGPYRFLTHPNYAVIVGEIFVLPMVFGLFAYAVAFSLLNAAVLAIRIHSENAALARLPLAANAP